MAATRRRSRTRELSVEAPKDTIIAHISDLHLSTDDARGVFDLLEDDISNFAPAVILVTGDLVDNPVFDDLVTVRDRLVKLCKAVNIDHQSRLIVVPGNHDYRWFGLFNWESVKKDTFGQIFPDWDSPRFIKVDRRYLAIFGFDSNTNDPKVNWARGRVGEEEYSRFNKIFTKLRSDNSSAFDDAYKIALLHHHPLPIPDTEIDALKEKDAFLSLEDAGTFMREMVEKKIDLILHGHKHCPFFARVKFATESYGEREITIVGAGSASKSNPGLYGNGYNIIRLKVDGTIDVEQRYRHTGNFRRFLRPTPILSYEGFRNRFYEGALGPSVLAVESMVFNVSIDQVGDCEFIEEFRNLRVKEGKPDRNHLPVDYETKPGTFGKSVAVVTRTGGFADPRWSPDSDSFGSHLKGQIRFSRPINFDTGPVSFDVSYVCFNAFALTLEQHKRVYGDEKPEFYTTKVNYPIGTLLITIHYPSSIRAAAFEVVVQDENDNHNAHEEAWCREHLHVSELTRTGTLVVPRPLISHYYGISWQLPSELESKRETFSPAVQGCARLIQSKLVSLNPSNAPTSMENNLLREAFQSFRTQLHELYPSIDQAENLDLCLMVSDERASKLRHVAGIMSQEYWDWSLYEGEGVAGRAYKLNSALLYVRSRVLPEKDWYIAPPGSASPHEVVFSVPLRYPSDREDGWVVGVLTVASTSTASSLLRLYNNQLEVDGLIILFQTFFVERILALLGLTEQS